MYRCGRGKGMKVGIYARLSTDHGDGRVDSIQSQILLAREWIRHQRESGEDMQECFCYTDIGVSGMTFEREGFQRMLRDAACGRIACVVCKDASRLGRDYLRTGEYIEKIFPSLGIRLVMVSEGYDSLYHMPGSMEGCMRNLMNEWYARDIGQRVHMVKQLKREQGHYLGSVPPYGMRVVWREGIRVLERDEAASEIIGMIGRWRRQGWSLSAIRERLWEKGVQPPRSYHRTGQIYGEPRGVTKWNKSTLRHIGR